MKRQFSTLAALLLSLFLLTHCSGKAAPPEIPHKMVEKRTPVLIRTIPHDSTKFTQGLFYEKGNFIESDGLYEESSLRVVDTNGKILSVKTIDKQYFAEGCALLNDRIYQITWQEHRCFVYSWPSLACIDTLPYTGEGWGITANETHLIMSNGSDTLYVKDNRLQTVRKIAVTLAGAPLNNLNELEYAQGKIFANVWFNDYIFVIDPETGIVEWMIDCSAIVKQEGSTSDQAVLNGIAYNPSTKMFYITGKLWKHLYIVQFT